MRRLAQRWWKSSESTSRGSATHSPFSVFLLLQQDKQHLSLSFQSKKRETLGSGLCCRFTATCSECFLTACIFYENIDTTSHFDDETAAQLPSTITEHCPKLLSREQRRLERSPWAVAARSHSRRMTEAAE